MKLINVVAESGGSEARRNARSCARTRRTFGDELHAINLDGLAILQRGLQLFTQTLGLRTGKDESADQRSEVRGGGLRGELKASDSGCAQELGKALFAGRALE